MSRCRRPPRPDFSIRTVGGPGPVVSVQQVSAPLVGGVYQAVLASWDRGGKVRITVTDPGNPSVNGSLGLPLDTDGDDLPDIYERNQVPGVDNANAAGLNVLDFTQRDRNLNGVSDRDDRFALDGLSNFEKYRGVYLIAPTNGTTGPLSGFTRLGAGWRNLFVRGRGFSDDPAIAGAPGTCGLTAAGSPSLYEQSASFGALALQYPCPPFMVGGAFAERGVRVWNVAASFTPTTVFPTRTLASTSTAGLDMVNVTLDAANCSGGQTCDHTSKTGIRQWNFAILGYSTFGTGTTFGDARVFLRALKGYLLDRPYRHQENLAGKFLPLADSGGVPRLAPITVVCDNIAAGSDNGSPQTGECTVGGELGGDVFVAGQFGQQLSAMDVNTDGCPELPFVSDPTILQPCTIGADRGTSPQATYRQVVRALTTHELLHAIGINLHTTDPTDLMYQYSNNWERADHVSDAAASLIQVHNKGLQ